MVKFTENLKLTLVILEDLKQKLQLRPMSFFV